jgi:hypothetical protein
MLSTVRKISHIKNTKTNKKSQKTRPVAPMMRAINKMLPATTATTTNCHRGTTSTRIIFAMVKNVVVPHVRVFHQVKPNSFSFWRPVSATTTKIKNTNTNNMIWKFSSHFSLLQTILLFCFFAIDRFSSHVNNNSKRNNNGQ